MGKKWGSITREDLIERMSEKSSAFEEEDIKLAAKNILEQLSQALCLGQRIELRGFGLYTTLSRTTYVP
jgi:integration host factor subunit beta